jgi:hypothetical protein
MRQIGNAVPVTVGYILGEALLSQSRENDYNDEGEQVEVLQII